MSSPFTIKKLTEVEDSAAKFGYGDIQASRFARRDLDAQDTGLSHHMISPGKRQPFAHRHTEAEEIYVVLEGAGRMKLDDEIIAVRARDAIRVAPGVVRIFEAGPSGLEILAFGPHHEADGELLQGWWSD